MAFNNTNNAGSHTSSHGNPIQNTAAALDPSTGTGSHLPPTDQSRNPLSSHNDHVDTAHSNNPIRHNDTTGTGHSSLTGNNSSLTGNNHGTTTHSKREDGGVIDAINPVKGGGAHLPNSGHNQTGHNQYDNNTHSSNPLSSNTHSSTTTGHSSNPLSSNTHSTGPHATGPHASTGAGLTGSSHATHGHRAEDGGVVDALHPGKGQGTHLPNSNTNSATHGTTHGTTGAVGGVHGHDSTTSSHLPGQHSTTTGTTGGVHNTHSSTTGAHTTPGAHNTTATGQKTDAHGNPKVPVGDKIKGTVESLVGKVTSNPAKVAEGEALKTGSNTHGAAAGVQNAAHNSSSTTGSHI